MRRRVKSVNAMEWCNRSQHLSYIRSLSHGHFEANGQVEVANKILISLIKKQIGSRPRTWHETLSQVLWAYQNSLRGSTGTSPYKLVYGHDAVLPLEINLNTLRILRQDELLVDGYWNAMYDELNDLVSERVLALENMIRQKENVARSYNRQVKEKYSV
ncbi:uncharacterized protein LOC107607764 [Arachis ipaensis]|uniref:uncharacterized protein LOC107607764 n=1 Tax=Arachis ipaensis TaxID=130454 RepID=UPI0007AF8E7F|nr:uncharacterized protein LOC107607764 [Arachis ipaensis]XP_025665185.1 uncharacterized protein LOC112763841 [Arachis hypogaea]